MDKRIRILEASIRALEEAADTERAERQLLSTDVETLATVLTNLIRKLDKERDAREAVQVS